MFKNFIVSDEKAIWALIFHHESKYGYFLNERQALLSYDIRKFSVLSKVDDSFKIDGYFEYLLIYPDIDGYSQWKQSVNPIDAKPEQPNGYQNISFSWSDGNSFNGLSRSSEKTTLLDGSPFQNTWFYAIGCYGHEGGTYMGIPGPNWTYNDVNQTSGD